MPSEWLSFKQTTICLMYRYIYSAICETQLCTCSKTCLLCGGENRIGMLNMRIRFFSGNLRFLGDFKRIWIVFCLTDTLNRIFTHFQMICMELVTSFSQIISKVSVHVATLVSFRIFFQRWIKHRNSWHQVVKSGLLLEIWKFWNN